MAKHLTLDFEAFSMASELDPLALEILRFWFPSTMSACLSLWFGKDVAVDDYIKLHFGAAVRDARDGKFDSWLDSPLGALALVILLDQFSRHVFRHSREMFSCDARALDVVMRCMELGYHERLSTLESVFFFLVLTHSEHRADQQLCVSMWQSKAQMLDADDPVRKFDGIFFKHWQVIDRFGRFPHRNALLSRISTPQELEFLADTNYRFDLPMKSDGTGFAKTARFEQRAASAMRQAA